MTWVKICGITNLEDAQIAVQAGADALGFVFYEKSPRRVDRETARSIVAEVPPEIEKVGVFVNQFEGPICDIAERVGLTSVQLHGDNEDPHVGNLLVQRQPDLKVLVGVSMSQPRPEGWAMMWARDNVYAFLADSGDTTKYGGTGETFDWQASRKTIDMIARLGRVIVAGGLQPMNVVTPIRMLRPWGVDVSSGVEARPGKKDPEKVKAFVEAVRQAEKNT
jgi:phosphoribosylanthranilate isomerase